MRSGNKRGGEGRDETGAIDQSLIRTSSTLTRPPKTTDGELLYEVPASSLDDATGSKIPTEPSYIILNTAISTTWGFPQTCPDGCACDCFDCNKPGA